MLDLLGRLHLLFLHLPIGMLGAVIVVEVIAKLRKHERLGSANTLLLLLTTLIGLATVGCGWLLARDGGYEASALFWHRWLGVGLVSMLAVTTWLRWSWQAVGSPGGASYASGLTLCAGLTIAVGHFGGTMTHGPDFLWPRARSAPSAPVEISEAATNPAPLSAPPTIDVYTTSIAPILESSCYECHGATKHKAGLRLDSPGAILRGGDSGPAVVAGQPDASPLLKLISLDPNHSDIMPPKGDPLRPEEIAAIRQWISDGATMPGVARDAPSDSIPATNLDRAASGLPLPSTETVRLLDDAGIRVAAVSVNGALLDIDASGLGPKLTAGHLGLISQVADNVVWLDLAGTSVDDSQLHLLTQLPRLQRLHLEGTAVTDKGLSHLKACPQLRYLNLYNTAITDTGLDRLHHLQQLEQLYLWQTQVTDKGVRRLQRALPDCQINRGE
ncbi:MAG: hypothetical protein PF961_08690 [Planctomycetota bacterium]|jgi:uncharacterized membrane protein/mono/diheme cytochrome c family protein|nr:hypothetical protein [Planctomycetota bacterium]